ncbi:MAG: tetratricopeptide repeat protein [Kofleriaceae bacterium]|nr:tetratricopeptide repeat protein [Kofleriaceae bacterium]MCB9573900.1 tetratricopeptide repeat protein [Kofleriaceae bacterium]
MSHPPHGAVPSFEDDVRLARAALAAGDVGHATHHVAGAVGSGADRPECAALIDAFCAAAAPDPLAAVPATGLWFGLGALRAALLVRAGRGGEAVPLLLACLAAAPTAPFVPWLARWLDDPDLVAAVAPGDVARELVACTRHEPLGAALHAHARRLHDAHPDHDLLAFAAVKLARMCWRIGDAVAIARAAIARGPMPMTSIGLAGALREDGDLEGAIAAFTEALRHDPDNVGIQLDLGDLNLQLGHLAAASAAYQAALVLEPENTWAPPSILFVAWRADGTQASADALRAYAAACPDNRRAQDLLRDLAAS